jgi:hypothetical protein
METGNLLLRQSGGLPLQRGKGCPMKLKVGLAAAAIALATTAMSSAANATVIVAYSLNGSPLTPVAAGPDGATFNNSFGFFSVNVTGGAAGPLPSILESLSLNVNGTGNPGLLNIFVTETDVNDPLGLTTFNSGFTVNELTSGWTVQEQTFLDPGNNPFGQTAQLGNATFTDIGNDVQLTDADTGAGPYSVTEQYTISAPVSGDSLATITISAVPEASTWAMMLIGFGAIGFAMRGQRQKMVLA